MKKLGQHFLINQGAIKKIVAALELKNGETVLEIGAGHGELTFPLTEACQKIGCQVIAIEKDPELGDGLKVLGFRNTEIVRGDALKLLTPITYNLQPSAKGGSAVRLSSPSKSSGGKTYKIVGNVPFYITGRLLRNISELKNKPELCVLTLQKEVALRICAEPPKMNRLAAIVQFWAEPKIIGFIPKTDFQPIPKVDSAIIQLKTRRPNTTNTTKELLALENKYYKIVKILFQQPRKTVANNLTSGLKTDRLEIAKKLEKLSIFPNLRPQNLSVEQIIKIVKEINI